VGAGAPPRRLAPTPTSGSSRARAGETGRRRFPPRHRRGR
jgi:hypothetical protein